MQPENLIIETQTQNTDSTFYSTAETLPTFRSIFIILLAQKNYIPIFKPDVIKTKL
jgi:hypothetical protein